MNSSKKCFEDLPDEIILSICRYLTQVNIFDSFLNLNIRLNRTISFYREQIYLSHLNFHEFFHILHYYLPLLSSNIRSLYINTCSMINVGKFFENSFNKIDIQFPLLKQLILYQIDIETLENLSWRFNTMKCLHRLDIDILNECLLSRTTQFDEFLCGKLFSQSNSFANLRIHFTKYYFNIETIKQKCTNIRQLTISIRQIKYLFILFEYLPNLEQLDINLSCSVINNNEKLDEIFPFKHLWWKVPYLTKFFLNITENSLISHENIPSNEFLLKLIENLYSLEYFRLNFDIQFSLSLRLTTNRDIYLNTYLPFIDGTLWERALTRIDQRNIQFELDFQLDGILTEYTKESLFSSKIRPNIYEDFDFESHLKNTFSSSYWLQKNISFDCLITKSKHISISTCPITFSNRTIINEHISNKNSINSHRNIENLVILLNSEDESSNLFLIDLFHKYPNLIYLNINSQILFPTNEIICSTRLRSLILSNCQFDICSQLLIYLPQVISLTINNIDDKQIFIPTQIFHSITRLKLIYNILNIQDLSNLEIYFPRLKEFSLNIENLRINSSKINDEYKTIENFSLKFSQIQYIEICLPYDKHSHMDLYDNYIQSNQYIIHRQKSLNNRYLILQKWM